MKSFWIFAVLIFTLGRPVDAADKIRVSSFSTILTEIAAKVGGDLVAITGHVKPGVDPHNFQPAPGDLKIVSSAQLVLVSGKKLDGYVGRLREATGTGAVIVEVGDRLPSITLVVEHGDHSHKGDDPHWWHSIRNIARATKIVREELSKLSPDNKAVFKGNSEIYLAELEKLQSWVEAEVAKLPRNQRKLVTNHDSFGYFAREFGFAVIAISGVSKNDQPGSKRVAELIAEIKAARVKAVFSEDIANPKLIQEITKETGVTFGGKLCSDGLGTGGKGTIEGMFRHNVSTIIGALK